MHLEFLELLGFLHCQRHTFRAGIRSHIRPECSVAQFCAEKRCQTSLKQRNVATCAGIRSHIRPECSVAQFCAEKVTISRPKLT
jgi:hypothetical protein